MKTWMCAMVAAAMLAACSPQGQSASSPAPVAGTQAAIPDRHPLSRLPLTMLTVESGKKTHRFVVEVANTPEAQARGLMFRTELGDDEGMVFPSEPIAARSFWMRNTPIPLDIIFVGVDGRISNIEANTVPYSLDPVSSVGLASAVLELRGGRAAELGIAAGDKVTWDAVE